MFDFRQEKFEIEVYGYTIVESVLTQNLALEMRDVLVRLDSQFRTEDHHGGKARHVLNLSTCDPIFFQIIDYPMVLPLIEYFMGEHIILGSFSARIVRPEDPVQYLHGDSPSLCLRSQVNLR